MYSFFPSQHDRQSIPICNIATNQRPSLNEKQLFVEHMADSDEDLKKVSVLTPQYLSSINNFSNKVNIPTSSLNLQAPSSIHYAH